MDVGHNASHRSAIAAATVAAGALIAQQVAGKATRDTLFLSTFDVSSLPLAMITAALVSGGAVIAFTVALARWSPARVVPVTLAVGTVLLLAEWGLSLTWPRLAAVAVYLHMAAFGATVVSGFWSLVSERFDPRTARRAMGGIGLGASFGGVLGGLFAWSAASLVPVPAMLAVMATLNVVSLLAMSRLRPAAPPPATSTPGSMPGPFSGLRLLRDVPYLRDIALIVALGAATETLLDYLLNARAVAAFTRGPALMSFFALFHTGIGLASLLVQMTLTRAALQGLGLAGTMSLRPAAVTAFALLGILDPRLWTALLARGAHGVLHNSLFRSSYELLFTPLPERRKRPTKTIVDVGFDKVGAVVGGLVTLSLVTLLGGHVRVLFALAAAFALCALLMSRRLHRGYVSALEDSLRSGVVRLDLGDVLDSTTYLTMARTGMLGDRSALLREVAALEESRKGESSGPTADPVTQAVVELRSGQAEVVRRALRRAETVDATLVGHLIPLLRRNDLFLDVLRPLRRAAPLVTGQLLDALLDPKQDIAIRRRIPRVLRGSPTQRAADGLLQALADPAFEVRRQAALTLARITEREPAIVLPRDAVFAATLRELQAGQAEWSGEVEPVSAEDALTEDETQTPAERGLAHVFKLLSLAVERQPLQTAYWALRGPDAALRGTALEYLETVLPEAVRRALVSHLEAQPVVSRPPGTP
jgi:ATP:ADP antiporter, AAA family